VGVGDISVAEGCEADRVTSLIREGEGETVVLKFQKKAGEYGREKVATMSEGQRAAVLRMLLEVRW